MEETDSARLTQAEASWLEAHTAYEMADFPLAAEAYERAGLLYEGLDAASYVDSLLGLALCMDHLGRNAESETLNKRVIANRTASVAQKAIAQRNLIYAEGVRNFANTEFAAAHASFAKALTLHDEDDDFRSDILMWMGACHSQLGQFAAAGDTYTDLLSSQGAHESVKSQASQRQAFAEGHLLFAARRYREARSKFEELLRQRNTASEFRSGVQLMLAHCCFHLSDYGQANRRYRQILKTRNASQDQKREARQWRRAVPGWLERLVRSFKVTAASRP